MLTIGWFSLKEIGAICCNGISLKPCKHIGSQTSAWPSMFTNTSLYFPTDSSPYQGEVGRATTTEAEQQQ